MLLLLLLLFCIFFLYLSICYIYEASSRLFHRNTKKKRATIERYCGKLISADGKSIWWDTYLVNRASQMRVEWRLLFLPPLLLLCLRLFLLALALGRLGIYIKRSCSRGHTQTPANNSFFFIFAVLLCCSSLFSVLLFVFSHFRNSKSKKKKKYPHLIIPNLLVCMYTPEQTRLFSILDEWTTTTATTISTDKWWRFSKTELCKIPFKIYNILVPLKDDDIIYACA